jgi:pimeloyl-ACP methyl ester carboxylesterase
MTLPISGGPLEGTSRGEGAVVLALHGGMGGFDQSQLLARALFAEAADHRVIAVSRPGYLGTPLAAGAAPEQQADLYAQALDRLGIDKAVVAAISAGGPSALQFALRHPDRCRALILVSCCTGRLEIPPEILSRMRWKIGRNWDETARRSIADPDVRARTLADPKAGPMLRELQLGVFRRLRERLPGTMNDTAHFAQMAPIPFDSISAPALVIHGTGDRVVAFSHAQAAAQGMLKAELFAIPGGEHVVLFSHLDEMRKKTAQFLARLGA